MDKFYQAFHHKDNKTSKTGNVIATVQLVTCYTGYWVHHEPNTEDLQHYPVVIVPSAFTRIETPANGPFPGPCMRLNPLAGSKTAP